MIGFPFSLSEGSGVATVTAFNANSDKPIYQADEHHPHWNEILTGLEGGSEHVWSLFDVAAGVRTRFKQVTERVSFDGDTVLFDGDPIHSVLSEQLHRAILDGNSENYTALAKFWEKLESNPNDHSREQGFDWLASHKFQITAEGDIVGYKYVYSNGDGEYSSCSKSQVPNTPSAFVNGNPIPPLSVVPQRVGDVVTMPRSEVTHDPSLACERGLHVGTFDYVGGGRRDHVLEVHVNPRDIVSVPTDGGGGKVRVCRYTVAAVADQSPRSTAPVLRNGQTAQTWAGDVSTKVD